MKTIKESYTNTIIINKSEFITYLFRVETIDEVNNCLSQIRKKHYDATHNCYAYILGANQEIQKASDDGEPQKTAGFPMLDVLKKNDMYNILAITTRYFGGILLGAGGLIRAYSSSVSEALKLTRLYELKSFIKLLVTVDYSTYNTLLQAIDAKSILNTIFTDNVTLEIASAPNEVDKFKDKIVNTSNGKASILVQGEYQQELEMK